MTSPPRTPVRLASGVKESQRVVVVMKLSLLGIPRDCLIRTEAPYGLGAAGEATIEKATS